MFSTSLRRLFSGTVILLSTGRMVAGERGSVGSSMASSASTFPRLHGTVTGFKHRRGYGFLLAEGVVGEVPPAVDVARLMTGYFFTRNSLMGGYYITEGERVSFDVQERSVAGKVDGKHSRSKPRYVPLEGEAAIIDDVDASSAVASTEGGRETAAGREKVLNLATNIQMFDLKSMVESPVEPIALRGKIVSWDATRGVGIVGELDTEGNYHADAPKFFLTLDDTDLGAGSSLRAGRYVRFCLENEDDAAALTDASDESGEKAARHPLNAEGLPMARRVIVDRAMEHRLAVVGKPLAPAGAPAGTITARSRFEGTVKSVNTQFGFVIDELSGESIFFHISNASRKLLAPGDRVSYMLRELTCGKHAGKKACFDVRRVRQPRPIEDRIGAEEVDDSEFDVIDGDELECDPSDSEDGSSMGPADSRGRGAGSAGAPTKKKGPSRGARKENEDFDLLS